jgi:hypothetical protein
MPTVPTYQGPQVRSTALEGGFQKAPDVSSDLARAGQGLAAVGAAVNAMDLRDAKARADQLDSQITTDWLKWDAENRNKFRGENVGQYEAEATNWWKNAAENYGKDLDPRTRSLASPALMRKQGSALANVVQFVGAEKERHADDTAAASITSTIQFGVTTGDVAGAAEQVRGQVAAVGARKGWTTEQVQAEQLKNLSALHLAQITKLASVDADKAAEYYQSVKGEVAASNQPRVEEVLKGESDNQFATKFAAENANKPLAEQLAEASKITDPKRREKTLQQVKLNHAAVKEAQAEQERQASDQAWQLVGQGKRVPEAILAQMGGKGRVQLQEHLQARAERLSKQGNAPVKTDPATLAKILDMARDNPDEFRKIPLVSLTNAVGGSDLEQIAKLQRDMNKPDKEKDVATTTAIIGAAARALKTTEQRGAFELAVLDELNRFEKEKGRPPSYEEKRKVTDRMLLDGEVLSGAWYKNDANKKMYEATPEERKRFAPTITSDDRKLIRTALEAEGVKNPTEAQVLERFKLAKGIK